jgi:hypothetical protein
VHDAGGRDAAPDLMRLVGVATERFLADDMLTRLGRGDRRLGGEVVRPAVVEELDVVIGDELAPVRNGSLESVPRSGRTDSRLSRPAIDTRRGTSGGGHAMYASVLYACACALPMKA